MPMKNLRCPSALWIVTFCGTLFTAATASYAAAGPDIALSGKLTGAPIIFRDQAFLGKAIVKNTGKTACSGGLYIRLTSRKGFLRIIDSRFTIKPGETKRYDVKLPGHNFDGEGGTLELIYRLLPKTDTVLAKHQLNVRPTPAIRLGQNFLANASFELDRVFGGTTLGHFDIYMVRNGWSGPGSWRPMATDGWWLDHGDAQQAQFSKQAHSGTTCLRLDASAKAVSVVSSLGRYVPAGEYTLSAYVRTKGAKGKLQLDFVTGVRQAKVKQANRHAAVDLPADAKDWTRVSLKLTSNGVLQPFVHITATSGTVEVDDVQLELGSVAGAFNVRPAELLRLSFDGIKDADMPKWITTSRTPRIIRVHNDSRLGLKGKVTLRFGPVDVPDLQKIGEFAAGELAPGESRTFEFSTHNSRADGYIASVRLADGREVVVDGLWDFKPHAFTAHNMQNMLHSRSVARFVVVPLAEPKKMFGIGNTTMVKTGARNPNSYLELHRQIRHAEMACVRGGSGDEETFMWAVAGGVPVYAQKEFDNVPASLKKFANPCRPSRIDVHSKEGQAHLRKSGESYGKQLAANPLVAGVQVANEQYWVNGGMPCPTRPADEHFRAWCKKRYATVAKVNSLWGTNYKTWDDVTQVISEAYYNDLKAGTKKRMHFSGLFWGRTWPKKALQELRRKPGKTMDWLRWRTETGIWAYKLFIDAAKKHDKRTLYGTDLPITNFYKQFFIPFVRATDAAMVNVRYTSGYHVSFGVPQECMDSLEMAESIAVEQNKPFWGVEIYHQPSWPAESVALQNWGLIAHGMSVPMIFSWHPKSDRARVTKVLEWEERRDLKTKDPFNRSCWYMIDADGAHLPAYDTYVRSLREVRRYHQEHDGNSIRRNPTEIAYYISNDSSEYDTLTTAATPWGAVAQRTCFNLIYLLRLAGITANYVDDLTLPDKVGKYRVVIVPYAKVLSQDAAAKLAGFAKSGGRVVLVGPAGQMDPWLRKYDNLGGPAWKELAWKAPDYREVFFPYVFDLNVALYGEPEVSSTDKAGTKDEKRGAAAPRSKLFRGVNFGRPAGSTPILDKKGKVVGYHRRWGKGMLVAYGIIPDTWSGDPHVSSHLSGWMNQLVELARLRYSGRWTLLKASEPKGNRLGAGEPVVDLVVRVKSPTEKFVFVLNQGGGGKGLVQVPVGDGTWQADNVIDPSRPVVGRVKNRVWSSHVTVTPLGYSVIRLHRK